MSPQRRRHRSLLRRLWDRWTIQDYADDEYEVDEPDDLDPEVARALDAAASEIADRRGQPAAAPLIADKLRLVWRLQSQGGDER